ncbi:hypothetical protein Tsubulata_017103 [Turnera subulata]|uniref:Uncharacterized protein n=1 Tax=Turnera subulata TaxID=218843 RepID=A0A9Q0J9C9_9ROSI|nr:hypothetical protein Tsubulata_017103 [Turnera subulata]
MSSAQAPTTKKARICGGFHPLMEGMNIFVFELAAVVEREKVMLDQCEAMLASTATIQVRKKRLTFFRMREIINQ